MILTPLAYLCEQIPKSVKWMVRLHCLFNSRLGRAIAEVVSRRLPTATA
jgi:hypothetical protein